MATLGDSGTLLILSALLRTAAAARPRCGRPSCVGFLPSTSTCAGTLRSLHHPLGVRRRRAGVVLVGRSPQKTTPCGPHSPFHKLLHHGGKILMLGCGLKPNTTMHALEEPRRPPTSSALPPKPTATDADRRTFEKAYIRTTFRASHSATTVSPICCPNRPCRRAWWAARPV
ncbi:MAG: AAC(3) family N-acetyltransferase [Caldilineaceae bacterium]